MRHLVWVVALLPGAAGAEFQPMTGEEISFALTNRALIYTDGATQDFRASGATLYDAGRPSWGNWAVRGDQYCSQWPPSDGWACYDMARDGEVLRFIAEDGSVSDGSYLE
ncbi:MAG: hypothetical protein AAGL89_06055 [Pseudomonadota bacterium]